ncbi:hypothetical protein D3C73_1499850 [compost metagenome]
MTLRTTAIGQSLLPRAAVTAILIRANQHKPAFAFLLQKSGATVWTMTVRNVMRLIASLTIFYPFDKALGHFSNAAKERLRLTLSFGNSLQFRFPFRGKLR